MASVLCMKELSVWCDVEVYIVWCFLCVLSYVRVVVGVIRSRENVVFVILRFCALVLNLKLLSYGVWS